ncbi:OmpA family protein [Flavobacteriaceae bacterium 14752]|uniref:OmpA family protein n=1 Tax=Mesohalobacter salilacus TaxID=2491711 RepID=UPI000F62FC10|nr:porin [Flavobacteriaceae bacterium 14752]
MKTNYYILLLFALLPCLGFSQIDKLNEANKKFENFAYIDAQQIYLEVAEAGYESENLFKKLGDSYYFNNDLENAAKWYQKLYDLTNSLDADYLFRFSQSLRGVERYVEASKIMKKYDSISQTDVNTVIDEQQDYLKLIELQSGKFTTDTISINSELSDFAPKFAEGKLIFASNRKRADAAQRIHEWNNQPFLDLYEVEVDEQFTPLSQPKPLSDVINSKFHEASAVITSDGNTIYFTRNNFSDNKYKKSKSGINFLKIYRAKKDKNGEWQTPEELPFNSDDYSSAHPALSPDEDKLYFASNMPGTKGKSDIFVVNINDDDSFGEPINLGSKINTQGRESFPYISSDSLLFFSSNGHPGLGGYDVFVSELKADKSFGDPLNVGRPINSTKDDISFIIDAKSKIGFFATNRNEDAKEDDIFRFIQNEELITKCKQYLSGTVRDKDTNEPIPTVTVKLFDADLNQISITKSDINGEYDFDVECNKRYIVRIEKDGYKTTEKPFKTTNKYEKDFKDVVFMEVGENLGVKKVEKGDDLRKILQLDPIYFELDKSNITSQASVELQKISTLMKQYPSMKIDIRSHTDSRAGDNYNMVLSQERAESTVNYLINQGVDSNRLSGKGYGESQLMNRCSNGVDCSEEEHGLNRRSEFIILNENETPAEMRASINEQIQERVANNKTTVDSKSSVSNTTSNQAYDFSSASPKVFTVQIAASLSSKVIDIPNVSGEYSFKFADGYTRYFSGVFSTRSEAEVHKNALKSKGVKGCFVVGLKGSERIIIKD